MKNVEIEYVHREVKQIIYFTGQVYRFVVVLLSAEYVIPN